MNIRNDEFYFYPATNEDNNDIDELLRNPDFKGDLQLLYTRGDNPVDSFHKDGDKTLILCGRHKNTNTLAGFGVCNINKMYIGGSLEEVAYLSGLRVHPDFRRKTLRLIDAYSIMMDWISENGVKYIITTILSDNEVFQKLVSKKRKNFPEYKRIGDYRVWIIPSIRPFKKIKTSIRPIKESELNILEDFYDKYGKNLYLYPKLDFEKLDYRNFRIVSKGDEIICSIYLNSRSDKKQILHAYEGKYSYIKYIRGILPLFGYPVLPVEGRELDYRYISYYLCKPGEDEILSDLILDSAMEDSKINYIAAGCMVGSKLDDYLSKSIKMSYNSILYSVVNEDSRYSDELVGNTKNTYLELSVL